MGTTHKWTPYHLKLIHPNTYILISKVLLYYTMVPEANKEKDISTADISTAATSEVVTRISSLVLVEW